MESIEKLPDGGIRMIMLSEGVASIKCTSKWNDSTKTAEILRDGKVIAIVTQGSDSCTINGKVFKLDSTVDNIDGRLWVPVAFFSKGLGCEMKLETGKPVFLSDGASSGNQPSKPVKPTTATGASATPATPTRPSAGASTTTPTRPSAGASTTAPARPSAGASTTTPARPSAGASTTAPARPSAGASTSAPARPSAGTTSPAATAAKK